MTAFNAQVNRFTDQWCCRGCPNAVPNDSFEPVLNFLVVEHFKSAA